MLRFAVLLLTVSLLENDVDCAKIGKTLKPSGTLHPRSEVPVDNWARLNPQLPLRNKASVNASSKTTRALNTTSKRQGKFFPKISFVAGVDIGSAPRAVGNLSNLAKVSQASFTELKPYIAASYDPFPANIMQQALLRLMQRLSQQVDNCNGNVNGSTFSDSLVDNFYTDNNKVRKDKTKTRKTSSNRKKQEKIKVDEYEDLYYDEEKGSSKDKFLKAKLTTKDGTRKQLITKQADTDTGVPGMVMEVNTTTTTTNTTTTNTTDNGYGNETYPGYPGYYFGGHPQNIGNVGITYDNAHESYIPPSDSYGLPAVNYGVPSTSYGTPSYSYGMPTHSYAPPSYSYVQPLRGYSVPAHTYDAPHYLHDHDALIYDDPTETSFGPYATDRWHQRLPFARSRTIKAATSVKPNRNGFVPI